MLVALGLTAALVLAHALVAAVATRYVRIRTDTRWGAALYILALVPLVLVGSTLVVTGPLGVGADLGSPAAVLLALVGLPLALGATVDVLYMPAPGTVEPPATEG